MKSEVKKGAISSKQDGLWGKFRLYLSKLGPGLIAGASGDDPSGIGTYSISGARFGYTQLWTSLFVLPLQVAIQEICARIALQTGVGLAENIRKNYPKPVLYLCVALLFISNTINIGADLSAMAASAQMLIGIPFVIWLVGITFLTLALEIFVSYTQYVKILRILTLSLLTYVVGAFVVTQDWGQALRNTVVPTIRFGPEYLQNIVAILGTTISPYLFFWQASEEMEEEIDKGRITETQRKGVSRAELKWMRVDVTTGGFFSNIVFWCIVVTAASTLYLNGIHNIDSAPKAAEALRPIAGNFAYLLFAIGIIGTGLLAVPVLAGSAAYAVAETFRFREGLYLKLRQAPGFYGVIALATLVGAAINIIGINPIQALYYAALINGIVAPLLLFMIMLISNNLKIMDGKSNRPVINFLGWVTTLAMGLAAALFLFLR